jgi:hypothetical protein
VPRRQRSFVNNRLKAAVNLERPTAQIRLWRSAMICLLAKIIDKWAGRDLLGKGAHRLGSPAGVHLRSDLHAQCH